MIKALATLCCVALLAAGCGSEPTPPTGSNSPSRADELTYGCGGRGTFTADDIEAERKPRDELLDALGELRETMDGAMLPADGWLVVSETDRRADLLAPSGDQIASASFEKEGGEWKPAGWGDCLPRLELADKSVLEWELADSSYPPKPEATQIEVLVGDTQCSSGRDLEGLIESEVTYTDSAVEVVLTAPPLDTGKNKAYTCEGNSPVEYQLELQEPIAEREVIDISVYPAREPAPGTARGF